MKGQLIITLEDDDSVSIQGPQDQTAAYGLLERARDVIQHHHAQLALKKAMAARANGASGIVGARLPLPRDLKGA
jgi:hypothetical protein